MTLEEQLAHKQQLVIDLHLQEDLLNRELSCTEKSIKFVIRKGVTYRNKISKQISHNMRLRNKVINEISELKRELK